MEVVFALDVDLLSCWNKKYFWGICVNDFYSTTRYYYCLWWGMGCCFDLSADKCGVTYLDRRCSVLVDLDVFEVVTSVRGSMPVIITIYNLLLQLHVWSLYDLRFLFSGIIVSLFYISTYVFNLTLLTFTLHISVCL